MDPRSAKFVPGELRNHAVAAGSYRGAPAEDLEYLTDRMFSWLHEAFVPPAPDPDIQLTYVILKAICAHVYFELIHPFGDGNGRTGRLLEFQILVSNGVPFPAAHLLSNHYNLTRERYYLRLGGVSRSGGDLVEFMEYAMQGFVDGLRSQIKRIQEEQLTVAWENYAHKRIHDTWGPQIAHRLWMLLCAMSLLGDGWVFTIPVLASLNDEIETIYGALSIKTLRRDLDRLATMELVEQRPEGFVVIMDQVRAFLPGAVIPPPNVVREE